MESLVFLIALGVAASVMAWYVANEIEGAPGEVGPLAIRADAQVDSGRRPDAPAASYRIRERRPPGRSGPALSPAPTRAYRLKAMAMRRDDGQTDGAADPAGDF